MKSGIDFFPLDVAVDKKLQLIEAEFGVTGFGVVVHLLQEIYGQEGYYIEWTDDVALLFSRKYGLSGNVVSEIVSASTRRGMFNQTLFDEYHVLTSRGIQKRYFDAVSRRKSVEVWDDILLVDLSVALRNVNIEHKNVNIPGKNVNSAEQSKVKKSKEKKINSTETPASTVLTLTLNDGTEYGITQADIDEWQKAFPSVDVVRQLHAMKLWCRDNQKKRKSRNGIRRFVTGWLDREQNSGESAQNVPQNKQPSSPPPDAMTYRREPTEEDMRALRRRMGYE